MGKSAKAFRTPGLQSQKKLGITKPSTESKKSNVEKHTKPSADGKKPKKTK